MRKTRHVYAEEPRREKSRGSRPWLLLLCLAMIAWYFATYR